jgi:FkbM family methyltransferase
MTNWIARTVVRHSERLASMSRVPIIGPCVRALGRFMLPSQGLVWLQIEGGAGKDLWMELNPRTGQGFVRGTGESRVQNFFVENLKPGMVVYDLGANCGYFSLIAARCVGPQGKVFSFEPEPALAARVRNNMRRNGFQHSTVVEAAVWRETGTVSFASSDKSESPDQGTGQITSSAVAGKTKIVPAIALDDYVKTAVPPDFIKCDVEGAEVEALRGAVQILSVSRPAIVCEIHSPEYGRVVRQELTRFGYTVRDLDENHIGALPASK